MSHQIVDGLQDVNKSKTQEGQETIKANVFLNGGDTLICLIADFIRLLENLDWVMLSNIYWQGRFNVDWEELKEEAKKMGYMTGVEGIAKDDFTFWRDGKIDVDGARVSDNRTPDQMLAIMKALQ